MILFEIEREREREREREDERDYGARYRVRRPRRELVF